MIKDRPHRLDLIYVDAPLFFVTFCTRNRRKISSLENANCAFKRYAIRGADEFNVAVGRYVIMPDHVHVFVRAGSGVILSRWVGGLKRALSAALKTPNTGTLWQPGFFDHVLRSDESYGQKWDYVCENPVRAGLVAHANDWPYQGEVVLIDRA